MALANYSDLLAAVANWMNRSDLTDRIPEFITLAEAEFNRRLRVPDMEARATVTITSGSGPLPSDSLGVREVIYSDRKLEYLSYDHMNAFDQSQGGEPQFWSINDGDIYIFPEPASASVTALYHQKIPALTVSNTTNWLMTRAPDLYLFACLVQAEFYGWNDERLPLIKGRVEEIIGQIQVDGIKRKHSSTPLAPRLRTVPTLSSTIRA